MLISIVVPTHNESSNIDELYLRLCATIKNSIHEFEMIFVDDSTDETPHQLGLLARSDARIRVIRLTRSFGQTVAIQAGLDVAGGDAVIIMDADLQDPPEAIHQFLEEWSKGNSVVYAVRPSQGAWPYRLASRCFYLIVSRLSDTKIPMNVGEFRLLDRKVVDFLRATPEKTRFIRGLSLWPGYPSTGVKISREIRHSGKTNYNFRKSANVAIDGVVGYSLAPLRAVVLVGLLVLLFAAAVGGFWIVGRFLYPDRFGAGWISAILVVLLVGGTNTLMLGVVAEYVGRIFVASQNRPMYVIAEDSGSLSNEISQGDDE